MKQLSRRDALIHLGLGTAGLLCLPKGGFASGVPAVADLTALAERFRKVPRREVFEEAARAIRAGADARSLLGAAFVAGVHDIRPRSVGGKLHAVMMVESAFQLVDRASERETWLAALWSLADFKRSQEKDRNEGDWVLPPRPGRLFESEAKARRELVAAMESWDADRADRAIVSLLPHHDRGSLFELLWPYATRCYTDIGHKIIFCAQVERILGRLGWSHAEPALRSLVNGLLYTEESGPRTAAFDHARDVVSSFPEGWLSGHEDPEQSAVLLRKLRACDADQAQDLVVAAFSDGLGPATVWDGLRLYATELYHRRPRAAVRRAGPVHPVTEINAFGHVFRTSRDERTRRLAILQAAGWLALLHHDLVEIYGPLEGPGIDLLGAEIQVDKSLGEVFEEPAPDRVCFHLKKDPERTAAVLERLRGYLVEKADWNHQYKYAAAVQEECTLTHRRWVPHLLAPAVTYVPGEEDPVTERAERSMAALRQAGVV